jgi:acyl carrier protein
MRESEWQTWGLSRKGETEMNTPKHPPVINSFSGLAQSLPDRRAVVDQDDNGKIDCQRLPVPETIARSNERGSGDDLLSGLTNLWEEVLHVSNIGIDDDFFELGGYSLPAILLVSRIEQELKKEISVTDAVKNSTIREMAAFLESTSGNGTKTVASS